MAVSGKRTAGPSMGLLSCGSTQPVRHPSDRFSTILAPARMQAAYGC
jgi:hypothetical protein